MKLYYKSMARWKKGEKKPLFHHNHQAMCLFKISLHREGAAYRTYPQKTFWMPSCPVLKIPLLIELQGICWHSFHCTWPEEEGEGYWHCVGLLAFCTKWPGTELLSFHVRSPGNIQSRRHWQGILCKGSTTMEFTWMKITSVWWAFRLAAKT